MLVLTHQGINSELVATFVSTFARLEYALKRGGFLKDKRGYAEPDWTKFEKSLKGKIKPEQNPELEKAVEYLDKYPAKKQVVKNEQLGWKEISKDGHLEKRLLRVVKTVRNNLFHGGKFPSPESSVNDVARDSKLLNYSIVLLNEVLRLDSEVARHFNSPLS